MHEHRERFGVEPICRTLGVSASAFYHRETGQRSARRLEDNDVLGSVGSTGDAYDNAMAESFVDSFKTELITNRVWHSRNQLELAIVEYISWFNDSRLHENLDDRPPSEIEELYAEKTRPTITTS